MEAADLTMICPSRGRPGNIAELARCWIDTGAHAKLMVLVDDDDPTLEDYLDLPVFSEDEYLPLPIQLFAIREPRRVGPILNSVVPPVAKRGGAIGFLGDDHRPRTPGWDKKLVDALPGVAYGNDLNQGERLATAVVMSAGIVSTLGYFVPPGAMHLYFDDFWMTLGRKLELLTYLPDVIIEHMHPTVGKASWDEGYLRANAASQYSADHAAYQEFLAGQWPADFQRLQERWFGE